MDGIFINAREKQVSELMNDCAPYRSVGGEPLPGSQPEGPAGSPVTLSTLIRMLLDLGAMLRI